MPRIRSGGLRAADWLALAAAPTFAVIALLTAFTADDRAALFCSEAAQSPLLGMVPMYLLMTTFHLAPWFRLVRD